MKLENKKVVVIGASSGIGKAVSKLAAEAKANVLMASRSMERLDKARAEINGEAEIYALDMLSEQSVEQFFERTGTLDHLIITAVADENELRSPIAELTTVKAERGFEKFWGSFFACRAAANRINKGGSITLVSSVSIVRPSKNISAMSAASGAVAAFARSLAVELAPIRVNTVAPGVVDTGVWNNLDAAERENMRIWAEQHLPAQHFGQAEDVAEGILFLMTNRYVTGVLLPIDGGLSLGT